MSSVTDSLYQQYRQMEADLKDLSAKLQEWQRSIDLAAKQIEAKRVSMKEIEDALTKLGTSLANASPRPAWPGGSKSLGV